MPPELDISLPFLTRRMLSFEGAATFDLEVTTASEGTPLVEIAGFTREGPFLFSLTTTATPIPKTDIFRLPDIPISVSIRKSLATATANDTIAFVYLRINSTRVMLLCQGHLGSVYGINWPNQVPMSPLQLRGSPIEKTTANPAAGVNGATLTVPAGEYWILKMADVTLVTDATAASRRVLLTITSPNSALVISSAPADQTASQTVIYSFFETAQALNNATSLRQTAPLPLNLLLPATSLVAISASNFQAGDDFGTFRAYVEKFFHDFT